MSSPKLTKSVKTNRRAIGERLKAERLRMGLTQPEMAEKLGDGRSVMAVVRYEKGQVPVAVLLDYGQIFGRSIDWLLKGHTREPVVSDPLEEYANMDRADARMIKELKELLVDADDEIKRHLRNQIKLLKRAAQAPIRVDEDPAKEE